MRIPIRRRVSMTVCALLLGTSALEAQWRLPDQFGGWHSADTLRGRRHVLLGADRSVGPAILDWSRSITAALGKGESRPLIVRVADLRGVPRFMRGLAASRLPSDRTLPILIDNEGIVARRHGLTPGMATLVVIDEEGRELYRGTGGRIPDAHVIDSAVVLLRGRR